MTSSARGSSAGASTLQRFNASTLQPLNDPMPQVPIIMPQLGESIAEATVINLLANVGDQVNADQDIIEVETNKATMNVTSPCRGRVEKWLVKPNESYPVGAALGYLLASADDADRLGLDAPTPAEAKTESSSDEGSKVPGNGRKKVEPTVRSEEHTSELQ